MALVTTRARDSVRHRRSLIIIALMLLMVGCLIVTGCESDQESAYKDQMWAIRGRLIQITKDAENTARQLEQSGQQSESAQSLEQMMQSINQELDTYLPAFYGYVSQLQAVQSDLANIQPPPERVSEHKMVVSGVTSELTALGEIVRGLELMRNPATMQSSLTAVEGAIHLEEQAHENLNKAFNYLYAINWPLTIGAIVIVLVVASACGYGSLALARHNGYDSWGYFGLGFLLGLVGLAITAIATGVGRRRVPKNYGRAERPPVRAHPQANGYYPSPYAPPPEGQEPLRGMVCWRCGQPANPSQPFCPTCGAALSGL